jgi:hypothetical protein
LVGLMVLDTNMRVISVFIVKSRTMGSGLTPKFSKTLFGSLGLKF